MLGLYLVMPSGVLSSSWEMPYKWRCLMGKLNGEFPIDTFDSRREHFVNSLLQKPFSQLVILMPT